MLNVTSGWLTRSSVSTAREVMSFLDNPRDAPAGLGGGGGGGGEFLL